MVGIHPPFPRPPQELATPPSPAGLAQAAGDLIANLIGYL